jgi:hypothetical protein
MLSFGGKANLSLGEFPAGEPADRFRCISKQLERGVASVVNYFLILLPETVVRRTQAASKSQQVLHISLTHGGSNVYCASFYRQGGCVLWLVFRELQ